MIKVNCKECGKVFEVFPSVIKIGKGKYCSTKCHYLKNPKVKKICKTCGKVFKVRPSVIKDGGGKYCSKKCYGESLKGKNNPSWKGGKCISGKTISSNGYILVYKLNHPFCINHTYVLEHRLVMEKHLGRYLTRKEIIHHINGNTSDNRIDNLMLFANHSEHSKHHAFLRKIIKFSHAFLPFFF